MQESMKELELTCSKTVRNFHTFELVPFSFNSDKNQFTRGRLGMDIYLNMLEMMKIPLKP